MRERAPQRKLFYSFQWYLEISLYQWYQISNTNNISFHYSFVLKFCSSRNSTVYSPCIWYLWRIPLGPYWWLSGKESACQCRRQEFDPWSGKIPHATEQLSLCTKLLKLVHSRVRALQQEKLLQWKTYALQPRAAPAHRNQRKPVGSNRDPAQSKINK